MLSADKTARRYQEFGRIPANPDTAEGSLRAQDGTPADPATGHGTPRRELRITAIFRRRQIPNVRAFWTIRACCEGRASRDSFVVTLGERVVVRRKSFSISDLH